MIDILQEILDQEQDDRSLNYRTIPQYIDAEVKLRHCHDRIQKAMGNNFIDELVDCESGLSELEKLACFRHGFRLAGRLFTELFGTRL